MSGLSLFAIQIPEYSVPMFISKSDDQKRFIFQRYILVRSNLEQEHDVVLTCYNSTVAGGVVDRSEKDNRPGWLSEAFATFCDINVEIDRSVEDNL